MITVLSGGSGGVCRDLSGNFRREIVPVDDERVAAES